MSSTVKVKLQRGDYSVDVEGTFEEATKFLDLYWNTVPFGTGSDPVVNQRPKTSVKKANRTKPQINGDDVGSKTDPADWANKIKDDSRFETFEEKILHKKDVYNRTAFVCWYLKDDYLTSGDIQKILNSLGVKIDISAVSHCLSDNSREFLTKSGTGRTKLYQLTGASRKGFEKIINSNESND